MHNYFANMVFSDLVNELTTTDEDPASVDLQNLGHKMMVITCMIVQPEVLGTISTVADITDEIQTKAKEALLTDQFKQQFHSMCQMDFIPDCNIGDIKHVKLNFIDELLTGN